VANPEALAAELAEHYARILGQQADRQVSDVVRTCLRRLPSRLPIQGEDLRAVEELVERLIRLGEVGARDPIGSPREIDDYIARRLGEPASGARRVYRALRAMLGHTVLVERRSRQIWVLCLSGLIDPSSRLHRTLLAETPALYSLPASDTDSVATSDAPHGVATTDEPVTPSQPPEPLADPSQQLRAELARLHDELAAERLARVEGDKRREAADAARDEEKRARDEADLRAQVATTQLTALEQEVGALRRALEQERQARAQADLRGQAGAAERTALAQKIGSLRRALDEERLARGEADKRGQVAEAELAAMRDAQAADAATMRRLIECDQALGAAAFLMARMHGATVEDAIQAVHRVMPAAAAVLLASRDQSLNADRMGGAPADPAADSAPQSQVDPRPQGALQRTSSASTVGPNAPALAVPLPSPLPSASASSDRSAVTQAPDIEPAELSGRLPTQRPRTSQAQVFPTPGMALDQPQHHVKPSKTGRNDPCPCGSGTKYKRCCGRAAP
jgi:hypothetical protein